MLAFRVLYQDESIVAVDKPTNFHTHPPEDRAIRISPKWNGLKILERQFGQKLYPVHRLDRASSGVLLLSKQRELNHSLQQQFAERRVKKFYACLVRGEICEEATIDRALSQEDGDDLPSVTHVLPIHSFTHSGRPFTFCWAFPETGRFHQIRRHLARCGHPLVGDSRHGDKKLNRAFAAETSLDRLFLRCMEMRVTHPLQGTEIRLRTRWSKDWHRAFELTGICPLPANRD